MLIEYKIKFEENGATITQRVEARRIGRCTCGANQSTSWTDRPSLSGHFEPGKGGGGEGPTGPGVAAGDPRSGRWR